MDERVIIIHSLEQAVTALKAARELDRPVTLASPPGAAAYTGALWFREVVKQAQLEVPQAEVSSILDCGDKPGLVMAAFRQGVLRVRFTGAREAAGKLEAMAEAESLHLLTGPLEALDLLDVKDKAQACRDWLSKA
jgi:fructose/tagatose bisphosphate aldolase